MLDKIDYSICDNITATTATTGRTYHTPNGDFPSVTTILGKTSPNNIWLQKWIDKVGVEEAERVRTEAADRGTLVHEYLEKYWNGEDVLPKLAKDSSYPNLQQMTLNLINATEKHVTDVYAQEIAVWNTELKYAGRIDMIGKWKGYDAIIDFKTSRKRKTQSQIKDYYLQCSAYLDAHNRMFGTNLTKIVILITVEDSNVQAFYGDLVHYLPDLKYRINTYYKNYHNI